MNNICTFLFSCSPPHIGLDERFRRIQNLDFDVPQNLAAYVVLNICACVYALSQIPQLASNYLYPNRVFEISWVAQFVTLLSRLGFLVYYVGTVAPWFYVAFTSMGAGIVWGDF